MVGWSNSTNKFGPGPFIVTSNGLGNGGNYSSVQTAINECAAAGGGTVFIRTGTYVENLTLLPTVDLYGFDVDGRINSALSHVIIQGNHTLSAAAGFNVVICEGITFTCNAGDLITINASTGAQVILAAKFCGFEAFTNPASRAFVLNADGASACQFSSDNVNISSSSHCFECVGAGSQAAALGLGSCNSSTGNAFELTAGSGSFFGQWTQVSAATYIANLNTANGNVSFVHSELNSGQETALFAAGGGQVEFKHCQISSSAGSGNFLDGVSGQYTIESVILSSSALGIGGTLTEVRTDWKPYSQSGAAPGLPSVVYRGTCAFDSAQFNVTNGFVQTIASGIFPWVDQPVNTTVVANQGNFATAGGGGVVLTLPAAPVQGDTCKFKDVTGNGLTVLINAGQSLQVGNQTGTQVQDSQLGDALELTWYAAGNTWFADSIIGNWLVS